MVSSSKVKKTQASDNASTRFLVVVKRKGEKEEYFIKDLVQSNGTSKKKLLRLKALRALRSAS